MEISWDRWMSWPHPRIGRYPLRVPRGLNHYHLRDLRPLPETYHRGKRGRVTVGT